MQTVEIVKALRWCGTGTEDGCTNCAFEPICDEDAVTCDANLCDAAADRLEELMERCARYAEEIAMLWERQRWIPVTERLPGGDGHYLCRYGFEGCKAVFYQTLDYYAADVQPHF